MISISLNVPFLDQHRGLFIATAIMIGWGLHWILLLSLPIETINPGMLLGAILIQIFLNTGLFITAHDAIHGLVDPANPKINKAVGMICAIAYAGLEYRTLAQNHHLHHRSPASPADPDFHARDEQTGQSSNFIHWYLHFMGQYCGWLQLLPLTIIAVMAIALSGSLLHAVFLWGVPLWVSSLQLFYFGTYQPHQTRSFGNDVTRKTPRYWLLSLLTCYHFSYHQEHHDYPDTPWWSLPSRYQAS